MPKVVGVRFRTSPRMYYFAPIEGEEYNKNDAVIVETQRGAELVTVVAPTQDVDESKIVAPLKPLLRKATDDDLAAVNMDDAQKRDILATAKEKVAARGLDMKVVDCEFTVDRGKLVLYFTAEQRVDFRELVRDLASAFHTRIDLRQIGPRDECKLIGTLGACGMQCCCGRFESDSEHVSIKMAKNQNLALTPNKINGMCGRLLCCLSYENKTYEDIMKRMPRHGQFVTTKDGKRGSVVSVTPLTEKVRLRVGDDESFEFIEVDLAELEFERRDGGKGGAPENQRAENGGGNRQNNGERKNKNRGGNNNGQGNGKPRRDGNGNSNGELDGEQKDGERSGDRNGNRNKNKNRHGKPFGNRNGENNANRNGENNNGNNGNAGGGNGNGRNERRNKNRNRNGNNGGNGNGGEAKPQNKPQDGE